MTGRRLQRLSYEEESRYTHLPEGSLAICRYCDLPILLDQQEGGGPAKDWGAGLPHPLKAWALNGGTGLDYGCGNHPASDEDGTAGHVPDFDSIQVAADREAQGPPDLDDLAAVTDLADDLGVSNQAVTMWHKRYPDFPPAVVTVARGQVALYSRRAVREWFDARKATAPPHWARRRMAAKP